jgi:hypothetical protein
VREVVESLDFAFADLSSENDTFSIYDFGSHGTIRTLAELEHLALLEKEFTAMSLKGIEPIPFYFSPVAEALLEPKSVRGPVRREEGWTRAVSALLSKKGGAGSKPVTTGKKGYLSRKRVKGCQP